MPDHSSPASDAGGGASRSGFDPDDETATESANPLLFRRYRVIRELGRGGVGVVFLAHDTGLEISVAVKLMHGLTIKDGDSIASLRKEVLRGMALTHPGIVRTNNFESDESGAGIVMEFIDGETLVDLKQRQPGECFDPDQILPWIEQLCAVLDFAHGEANIVHRDLKPRNIMITKAGRVKVADFGISAVLGDTMSRHSMEGIVSGTLCYMSPQQAEGKRPSREDDIHALGATIYELLTSKPPFFRGNQAAIFHQVLAVTPPSMAERREELEIINRPAIPLHWEETVAACLAKDPAQRPMSAGDVLGRLKEPVTRSSAIDHVPMVAVAQGSDPQVETGGRESDETVEYSTAVASVPALENAKERETFQREPGGSKRHWLLLLALAGIFGVGVPVCVVLFRQQPNPDGTDEKVILQKDSREKAGETKSKENAQTNSLSAAVEKTNANKPFVNSLGMEFVPVPGTRVLFCRWETRVRDFKAFVASGAYDLNQGEVAYTLGSDAWEQSGGSWRDPKFDQSDDQPVVCVSWDDARAFCEWLSKKDGRQHRLPKDHEWSCAAGIGDKEDRASKPSELDGRIDGVYPWGTQWPPPAGAGNYADLSWKQSHQDWLALPDYTDGFPNIAPVGKFAPNSLGIYDLGGNALEWCEDWFVNRESRVLRGGSFSTYEPERLRTSARFFGAPAFRFANYGFRVVVEE